jgi:putative membrane protein
MWWSDYWPGHLMFFGPMTMFLVLVIICAAGMFLMMRGGGMRHDRGTRALDILKERYARGEIDQAEFEERRRSLQA